MEKTMLPRDFVIWKDDNLVYHSKYYYWRIIENPSDSGTDFQITQLTLDEAYMYWRLERT